MRLPKANFVGLRITFLITLALSISSCSSSSSFKIEDPDPKQSNIGLTFGYFDMNKAPSALGWVTVRRYRPSAKWYKMRVHHSGLFYHLGLDLGSYQVLKFGSGSYAYNFGFSGKNETARRIKKPGAYYLGSYEYRQVETEWLAQKKFSFQKAKKPTEKDLLIKLLKIMKSDHSEYQSQIKWIKKRITQL